MIWGSRPVYGAGSLPSNRVRGPAFIITTIAYVLKGECLVRWGERGEFSAVAREGSFIHVPAWLPHMEINQSLNSPFEWVVVRSTAAPIVVNLPDDYWN